MTNETLRIAGAAILVGSLLSLSGCGVIQALLDALQEAETTTVELRNQGDFPVEVLLYFDDDQETVDGVIQETGTERTFTIADGATESFSEPCEELQAVIIDDADLQIVGDVGPEDRTGLLRDGDDFGCGDTIVFTLTHSDVVTDFEITVSVEGP